MTMPTTLDCLVLRDLYGTPEIRALLDSRALVQGWLDAERALALAQAEIGVIPAWAADRIAQEANATRFDLDALRDGIADSQHPLVPLIRALVDRCGDAGGYVHWGATTQDIMDTGMVLQARAALRLIAVDLGRAIAASRTLAAAHGGHAMAGRTHGQHAVPIGFGHKVESWADELGRVQGRLDVASQGLSAQLAGAGGTLAALGVEAAAVRRAYARRLGLSEPSVSWHVARDRVRDLGHALAQLAAASERIAGEVIRLQATEVAEAREPAAPGHVGSSTMPQKRNPMTSEYIVASARLLHGSAVTLEFSADHAGERDMGRWAVEWIAVPQALILGGGLASKLAWVLEGLEVDTARMRTNLDMTRGTIMAEAVMMALARFVGHERAHQVIASTSEAAITDRRPFIEILAADETVALHFDTEALATLLDPEQYLGDGRGTS